MWVFRYMVRGKVRDMGLGRYPEVSLVKAREAASAAREHIRAGRDPIQVRQRQDADNHPERTFKLAAEAYIKRHRASWRNPVHAAQWSSTLETYVYPTLGNLHVREVDAAAVLGVLQPIWIEKTETASRLRGRIEAVLDAAKSLGWREGENPARWKGGLASLLPRPSKVVTVKHHPSLPWARVPSFLMDLDSRAGNGARALELAILTAARSNEVRGMTWGELALDGDKPVWTVPAARMKGNRLHRVPLSSAAVALLRAQLIGDETLDALVFPSSNRSETMSNMTLTAVIRRMNGDKPVWVDEATDEPAVPHGFRSTFRVWAAEVGRYPRELIEAALAHTLRDKTEGAYQRSDLLERRRALMEDWGRFCTTT